MTASPEQEEPAANATWDAVNQAWDRIEVSLQLQAPHLLELLGPPATAYEASLCQEVFGLPDAVAACVARHRFNWISRYYGPITDQKRTEVPVNANLYYEDVVGVLDACRNPADGSYDVSDADDLSESLYEPWWLTALEEWADALDAAR
jgi:hypothetical protein